MMDYWQREYPGARCIFVYRDPAVTAWSMSLHDSFGKIKPSPISRARLALDIWQVYNQNILQFVDRHPEQCLLLSAPEDFNPLVARDSDKVIQHAWRQGLEALNAVISGRTGSFCTLMPQ